MTQPASSRRLLAPLIVLAAAPLLAGTGAAPSSDWPHWRGPTGNGVSADADPPLAWSPTSHVAWKVPIPGEGTASPIVWRDRVFIATAIPEEASEKKPGQRGGTANAEGGASPLLPQRFVLIALDRADGKVAWQETAVAALPAEGHHPDHGFASASPFTDGERVYAHFGSRGIFAYTLDGKPVWKRTDLGPMRTRNTFGEGSSPTIHGELVIIPWDHEGPSYITALDKRTGATLWKTDRDEPSSWGTPLVVESPIGPQVVTTGERFVRSYDLKTGKELWRVAGQTGRPIPSPVAGGGLVFVGSGFRGAYLGAFRLDKTGNLSETGGVAWSIDKYAPDVPSPLLVGKRLYFHSGRSGILSCHDAESGKPHYSAQRVEGLSNVYASPVGAAGRVYLTGRDGTTVVIADDGVFKVLSTCSVGEPVDATPALAGKDIIIRGKQNLYCVRGG